MRFAVAVLASSAEVHGGQLFMLGGGVNLMGTPIFPVNLNAAVALTLQGPPDEMNGGHSIKIDVVAAEDGTRVGGVEGAFEVEPSEDADLDSMGSLAIPLTPIAIPSPGTYWINVGIDDELTTRLSLKVRAV